MEKFVICSVTILLLLHAKCDAKAGVRVGDKVRSREDMSKETILFRDKLNQILDAESKEVNLLKNLLDEDHEKEEGEATGKFPQSESVTKLENASEGNVRHGESLEYLREHGIVAKLEENSKRMEKMVVFMVDLRNLLTEALAQQNRGMGMEIELVEMREEMEYLRKEIHSLKSDQRTKRELPQPKEHQHHNDHTTLEWLKASISEQRSQISELSQQCNVSVLLNLREKIAGEAEEREQSLREQEHQWESLKLLQMRQGEQVKEVQASIHDLRQWQGKVATKISAEKESVEETETLGEEQRFITEELKAEVGKPTQVRHHLNQKRLKWKVQQLEQQLTDLSSSLKDHDRRLSKMESSRRSLRTLASTGSHRANRNQRSVIPDKSFENLERSLQEYAETLERLNIKVAGMDELQESNKQLFHSIEGLEKKYDERLGETQTAMARLESGMSTMSITTQDLKEQQTQQSSAVSSLKKDVFQVRSQQQANHLRLAAIQSELVRLAGHKCSADNTESIQNIRIATLEHKLLHQDPNQSSLGENEQDDVASFEDKRNFR